MTEKEKTTDANYRAALYIRLSKEDGDKPESNSISNQRDLIYAFLRNKEDIAVCGEKVDDGYSGATFDRPAVKELLEEVRQGRINCIIVKDLSRFGRNYIETGRYLQQIFPFLGVRFIAVNDGYDSLKSEYQMDNIILPFKNLMNDSYCRDISVKVRSQIEVRQKRGDYVGSFPVYGYFRDSREKGRLIIDETAAVVVQKIFAMRIAGKNNRCIADYLNEHAVPSPMEYKMLLHWRYSTSFRLKPRALWSPVAIDRILKNEIYTGTMVQGKEKTLNYKVKKRIRIPKEEWIRVEGTHEAIIERNVFEAVQKLLQKDTRTSPVREALYPFSGILRCADCGGSMVRRVVRANGGDYAYYVCSANKNDKTVCSSHRIREERLASAVFAVLKLHVSLILSEKELTADREGRGFGELERLRAELLQRREELVNKQRLKNAVYEDYRDGLLSQREYLEMKAAYENICGNLERAICLSEREISALSGKKERRSRWAEYFGEGGPTELSRGLLVMSVEQITVFDAHRIGIRFRYSEEVFREI